MWELNGSDWSGTRRRWQTGSCPDVSAWAHFSASSSNQLPQLDVDYCQRLLSAIAVALNLALNLNLGPIPCVSC